MRSRPLPEGWYYEAWSVVSVLVLVRVRKVNTKVSSQMLDVVTLSRLEPAQLHRYGLSVLAEYRGTLSLLLLLQLLISAPLSWKHFTNYKSTYEPIHACEFMWTVSCALSGVCRIGGVRAEKEQDKFDLSSYLA